ncbi:MAG: tRNA epoxyqueuosine(34) reductase QueG [Acidobacteria bacterium]|nr:tRNA epoxyqueuosine(34) reductase QueG [Acidobacteriota bacterium]
MKDLKARLLDRAAAEGFDLAGVAACGEAPGAARLRSWLASGFHGEMAWLERTAGLREDPRRLLPGCRSVVVVAMSYHTSLPLSIDPPPRGTVWISRYAWGRDYHRLMKKRLIRLGRWLEETTGGCAWRASVDTAPVPEREWAALAGLGWIGKNTCLINRRLGSELFLGVLLTDVALPPDPPAAAHCGRCTACLDACPTGALLEPGLLDARRCIAYLTVEHRGPIAATLAGAMGANVAGCDICQEVCPWTRRSPETAHPELQPAPHRFRPSLSSLEALDEAGWKSWRQGSPLNRIPFEAFHRNLAIARSNLGG